MASPLTRLSELIRPLVGRRTSAPLEAPSKTSSESRAITTALRVRGEDGGFVLPPEHGSPRADLAEALARTDAHLRATDAA